MREHHEQRPDKDEEGRRLQRERDPSRFEDKHDEHESEEEERPFVHDGIDIEDRDIAEDDIGDRPARLRGRVDGRFPVGEEAREEEEQPEKRIIRKTSGKHTPGNSRFHA